MVSCKAKLKVSKKFNDESVIVKVSYHTNHTRELNCTRTKKKFVTTCERTVGNYR